MVENFFRHGLDRGAGRLDIGGTGSRRHSLPASAQHSAARPEWAGRRVSVLVPGASSPPRVACDSTQAISVPPCGGVKSAVGVRIGTYDGARVAFKVSKGANKRPR